MYSAEAPHQNITDTEVEPVPVASPFLSHASCAPGTTRPQPADRDHDSSNSTRLPRRDGSSPSSLINDAAEWNQHRGEIIRLYWEENLSTRQVQEIMKSEHGFDKSIKKYRLRFKAWGVRKNISEREALELAAGQAGAPAREFWPSERDPAYRRRIERHLRKRKDTSPASRERHRLHVLAREMGTGVLPPAMTMTMTTIAAPLASPRALASMEKAWYYSQAHLATSLREPGGRPAWSRRPACPARDEEFFGLFIRGMDDLALGRRSPRAFTDINEAFDRLKGLVAADHPFLYHRIAGRVASCKSYPASAVCLQVCRLLARYCLQLTGVVHGRAHPAARWWEAYADALASGELGLMEVFMGADRLLMAQHLIAGAPLTNIAAYVPSGQRGVGEHVLRRRIEASAAGPEALSKQQEARLALAESQLEQGRKDEALGVLGEASALRHLDPVCPVRKTFWIAELLWWAGDVDGCLEMLKETLRLQAREKEEEGFRGGSRSGPSEEQVLILYKSKCEWLGRQEDVDATNVVLNPLLAARRTPGSVHFEWGDFEVELDVRYAAT